MRKMSTKLTTITKSLITAIIFSFGLASCGLEFEVQKTGDPVTIDGQGALCPATPDGVMPPAVEQMLQESMVLVMEQISEDISQEVDAQDTGPASTVYLSTLIFDMTTLPATLENNNTLGFLNSLSIYAEGKGGAPRILIAEAPSIAAAANRIDFAVTGSNIKDHVEEGMIVDIEFTLRDCPKEDITFEATFGVTIGF